MRRFGKWLGFLKWWAAGSIVLTALGEGIYLAGGGTFSASELAVRAVFVALALGLAWVGGEISVEKSQWQVPLSALLLLLMMGIGGLWYGLTSSTMAAWVLTALSLAILQVMEPVPQGKTCTRSGTVFRWGRLWLWRGILSLGWGLVMAGAGQMEARFAAEEFFVALQVLALSLFGFLFLSVLSFAGERGTTPPGLLRKPCLLPRRAVILFLLALFASGVWAFVRDYQHSFYPSTAPIYDDVTAPAPFKCGSVPPDPERPDGREVFSQLLSLVEANPRKGVLEYGMLTLGTGERRWAEEFRQAILQEARDGKFTKPAHSVKSVQYEAALRAYYLPRIEKMFPDLFSSVEQELLRDWFAAINRRALSVEWVDWLYALAFSKRPEGPYENQENGAGLLALLEKEGLSAPELSSVNRDYLQRYRRGWFERFRVTDDALIYQPEWITNAYFQWLYWESLAPDVARNRDLSFEWLLLQALPDGAPLSYNHPARPLLAGTAYLGARLTSDPRYVWWAARTLDWAERTGTPLYAQPGAEVAVPLAGASPQVGSCLLYGDSGLPNQQGPLAPDKVVFRNGWSADAMYLLLNLRFTGWHRYRATNSVVLFYWHGPLVSERLDRTTAASWLPLGRRLFRDKRIPRENLNGLLIPRQGIGAVLHALTGIGGPWAQDPPYYAEVETFKTLGPLDVSRTVIKNWHGWRHTRTVYFFHDGPVVVVDYAHRQRGKGQAAIVWHLTGDGEREGNALWLRRGDYPVQMVLPEAAWPSVRLTPTATGIKDAFAPACELIYQPDTAGGLYLVTVFLPEEWAGGQVNIQGVGSAFAGAPAAQHLLIISSQGSVELLHNETIGNLVEAGELHTKGLMAAVVKEDGKLFWLKIDAGS